MTRKIKYLPFPIWSLCVCRDFLLVSGGGGGKKFGIRNRLMLYKPMMVLTKAECEYDTGDEAVASLEWGKILDFVVASVGRNTMLIRVTEDLKFETLLRFNSEEGSGIQKVATVSKDNSLIATGGEAGVLKVWRLKPKPTFTHELVSTGLGHKGDITAISIAPSNIVVCTCCVDKVCRIFQVRTGIKLYTLQFSDKASFVPLVFKGCAFSTRGDILYTLGTNPRGQAYITQWNAQGRYHPIDSYNVHKNPACSIKLSSSGKRMTIACNDGLMKVLDTTDMKIKYSKELFEMPVTGVDFFSDEDKLVVGSADYGYEFVIMKDMGYTKYLLVLFAMILLYCLYPLHLIDY